MLTGPNVLARMRGTGELRVCLSGSEKSTRYPGSYTIRDNGPPFLNDPAWRRLSRLRASAIVSQSQITLHPSFCTRLAHGCDEALKLRAVQFPLGAYAGTYIEPERSHFFYGLADVLRCEAASQK